MTNEQRAEKAIQKYGFDFNNISKSEIISLACTADFGYITQGDLFPCHIENPSIMINIIYNV